MKGTKKIVKSLKDSGIRLKGVTQTIENGERNKKRVCFLGCYSVHWVKVYQKIS